MLKELYFLMMVFTTLLCISCSDDENVVSNEKNGPKPNMNLVISPQEGLNYGDKVNISGPMTDKKNLDEYNIYLMDSKGDTLATKNQMLLGQSFNMNDYLQIPLPKNASPDNLSLGVKLDNTRNGEMVQTFNLIKVGVPSFGTLHLILSNGQIIDLVKNGDIYESPVENVFPANIKGIISTTTSKNGIYWGSSNGEVASMAKDSIVVGGDTEASFTVAFNPITFEFSTGERHIWSPIDAADCYYILGTISGDWRDGEITTERQKMKMSGFESGSEKYYTWTPPEGDNPETGMWGSTAAGVFRLKKGSTNEYILWDGKNIIQSQTDDKSKSFPLTIGGPFTIKTYFTNGQCASVQVAGNGKSIIFSNHQVIVNGNPIVSTATFAGSSLPLKEGTSYIYEGRIPLTQGQSITSAFDLTNFLTNSDLFNGAGNSSWTLKTGSDTYIIRMDAFSGAFYACPTSAYPNAIYMDGWSWGPTSSSNAVVWDFSNILPLARTSGGTYEATFYDFGWGGDVAFYVTYPSNGNAIRLPIANFNSSYLNPSNGDTSFKIPSAAGYYKVVIDLKNGINISSAGTVTPKGNAKFTLNYEVQ